MVGNQMGGVSQPGQKKNLVCLFKAGKVVQSGSVPGHADSFTGTSEWKELFGMEWK